MLTLKNAHIRRVEECRLAAPLSLLNAPSQLVADNMAWLTPDFLDMAGATFPLVFQSWILQFEDKLLVIDPCNGNGRERPLFPQFHQLHTPFMERLNAAGVKPEDVDFVFCTHLHCDHCGWNTQRCNGRWVPTFPNARYIFVRREVERWGERRDEFVNIEYNAGVYEDSVRPILEAGLATLVEDNCELMAGLSILPAYGHTMGHSILWLTSAGEEVVFTGDAFHHPLQVLDPTLHLDGCDDLSAAIATRQRLRTLISERDAIMLPAHFPSPHGGTISRHEDGFRFKPLSNPSA